jgi:hypothetical protein
MLVFDGTEKTYCIKQYNCDRPSWTWVEKTDMAKSINNKQLDFYLSNRASYSIDCPLTIMQLPPPPPPQKKDIHA